MPLNRILCGDCVEVLKDFPDNSIDLVVTDPPYGLSFMGKDWDKALPSREAFEQIIRVLKPGALAFVMSSPRQDLLWRMLSMLEGVGFELTQSYIDWIYKTGFPKAYDVSKGIDKRPNRLSKNPFKEYCNEKRKELVLSLNEINKLGQWATTGGGVASGIMGDKKDNIIPSVETYNKLKKILQLDNRFDKLIEEAEREVIGKNHAGFLEKNKPFELNNEGYGDYDIKKPETDLAKQWSGWKSQTGLKPAHEPILMVNKPFSEPTIVDNVLRWGTGAINVDACRIPFHSEEDKEQTKAAKSLAGIKFLPPEKGWNQNELLRTEYEPPSKGRFPANLLVSDKAIDTGKITKGIKSKRGGSVSSESGRYAWNLKQKERFDKDEAYVCGYDDVGGQSRYFDLDAWAKHHGFLDIPKPDNSERDFGLKGRKRIPTSKFNLSDGKNPVRLDGAISNPRRNTHPTVKPIKLMAYLIELGCPPDGVVLDPFVGSGTTCIAAKKLVRRFIGIEINPEYCAMAQARVDAYPVPLSWFVGSETEDVLVPPTLGGKKE